MLRRQLGYLKSVSIRQTPIVNARVRDSRCLPLRFRRVYLAAYVRVHRRLVFSDLFYRSGRAFDDAKPPRGWIERAVVVVQRRVDVVEIVPDWRSLVFILKSWERRRTMADNDAAHLILGHRPMHNEGKGQEHPGQVWRLEDQQPEETEHGVRVLPAPDVDERAGQGRTEEGHGEHGRDAEEQRRSECEEPCEVCRRATGRFLEQARVSLEEEDVVEEVEAEWAEVEEGGEQSPVLCMSVHGAML